MSKYQQSINPIRKILVANRGEIACRIMRTCRKLGIHTVAVYADVDRNQPFVDMADEAVALQGNRPEETYLNMGKILDAAKKTYSDAIHPGYGFLAENPQFAAKCIESGLIFIGPSPEVIDIMGSKLRAKKLLADHGIPVVPGYYEENQDDDTLYQAAERIGFPLLIKASAGGGGKGMKIVRHAGELKEMLDSARRESRSSFGDPTLMLERYFDSVRHIEVQVFGDHYGDIVHLFERECTIQRRYQKIIEESPSPALDDALRSAITEAAVRVAKTLNYSNAGTVEFILTPEGKFYFLEVNTRLQVEHPVTESITGIDLVEWQIRIAEGHPLPLRQSQITSKGYALECRLYAEDPDNGFLPSTGQIQLWRMPQGTDVRVDAGITEHSTITIHFDPMIAKIIAWAGSRWEAFRKMDYFLSHLVCSGVKTNRQFLLNLLRHPSVQKGDYDTHFINDHPEIFRHRDAGNGARMYMFAAATLFLWQANRDNLILLKQLPAGWRNNFYQPQQVTYIYEGEEHQILYRYHGGKFFFTLPGNHQCQAQIISFEPGQSRLVVELDRQRMVFYVARVDDRIFVAQPGVGEEVFLLAPRYPVSLQDTREGDYTAPLPGEILKINVKKGEAVKKGDLLVIVSSMKMENSIKAHDDGVVEDVYVQEKTFVEPGTPLLRIVENNTKKGKS